MKKFRLFAISVTAAMAAQFSLMANESIPGLNWLDVVNRLSLEYDDNVRETSTNKEDSLVIKDEIDLGLTLDFEPTFLTLRYRPSYLWWENREPDDSDFNHMVDAVLNHRFTPRLSAGLKHTYRMTESPEEIDRGTVIKEEGDYEYNVTDANVDYQVLTRTHAVVGGRYTTLSYDNDDIAQTSDFDSMTAGLTLRHQLTELSSALADYRREDLEYDYEKDRGAVSDYIGLGYEQAMGASFVGVFRAGYEGRNYDAPTIDNESQPYGDVTVTYLHSPRTRLSLGGGYALVEADVYPFAAQDRTTLFTTVAHDLTARITLYLAATYQLSEYSAETRIDGGADASIPQEGDEKVLNGSASATYRINARNAVEASWQYLDLSSDIRDDFDRNRFTLGWRLDL